MRPLDPRLLRHARGARAFVVACAALGVLTAGLVLAQAELLAGVISQAFLGGAGISAVAVPLGVLTLVVLARAAVSWVSETAAHRASAGVLGSLRAAVVRHALGAGPTREPGHSPAELATLATRGVDRLDGYFARYLPALLIATAVPAVVGTRILLADPLAALIVGITVPLIPLFMILIGLATRHRTRRQWRTLSVLGNHFLDLVAGLAVLTAFGRARAQRRTLAEITSRYRIQTMRTLRIAFLSALVLELLATLSVAVIAVTVGLRLVTGSLDLHTALLVLILAPEVYLPLRAVGARFHDSAEGLAAAEDIVTLVDSPPRAGRRSPAPDPSRVPVRLRDVTVLARSNPVLDRLTLSIEPGEIIGITGPSGVGKSTLLDLLLAWYPPSSGQVHINGVDLTELDRSAWHERVAWLPQRPALLSGTVADNIRLGAPHATDEQVALAARTAALDIPLWTNVGELGAGLSTGQIRRVALARAILLDRPLMLLDEPTEGVDAETEAAIIERLPGVLAGRTAVIVSHRESVLDLCDWVVPLTARVPPPRSRVPPPRSRVPPPRSHVPSPRSHVPSPRSHVPSPRSRVPSPRSHVPRSARWRVALACLAGVGALGSGVALAATSAWLISAAALHPPVLTLMVAIVAVRTFGLAKGVLRYAERLLSHDVALRALARLRVRVWDELVRLGPAVTARLRRGDLLERLVSDVDNQQDVLVRGVVPAVSAAVVGAATAVGIGILLPEAGMAMAIGLLAAGVLAPAVSVLTARRAERRTAALRARVTAGTVELLGAAPDLIACGATESRHAELRRLDARLTRALRASALARGAGAAVGTLAIGATTVASLVLGILALRSGRLPGPELAVLALTPLATTELVAGLPEAATRLLAAHHSARRLADLAHTPTPITDPHPPPNHHTPTPNPAEPRMSRARGAVSRTRGAVSRARGAGSRVTGLAGVDLPGGGTAAGGERGGVRDGSSGGRLEVTELSVRWPGADADAVRGVSLDVQAHRGAVLTGASGAGKSTVIAAIMRQLEPSAGRIVLDTVDTRLVAADDVRARMGWCGADTHLFDSTLRENLRVARPGAGDGELVAALRRARLGAWLAGLPEGLDTALGAHGSGVSGGERQRIGVARVLLADRPLLLLDEPTAHLDGPTAEGLAADLRELAGGRAALIVTHRPSDFPDLPVIVLERTRRM